MKVTLDFERPVADLETRLEELKASAEPDLEEIKRLEAKAQKTLQEAVSKLTPWQKVQIARHQDRPRLMDFINGMIRDFTPLAGDRLYGEDDALIAGLGRLNSRPVAIFGQERGRDVQSRLKHNFGMAHPEGYRKAQRIMDLANRFDLPIVSLVDTPGAYPGVGAEERGQAEAIARCIDISFNLTCPYVATVIGEGGSGGAIAIATANRILMMEHAVYSVISPEGCSSILWRSSENAKDAAEALKITAQDLIKLGIIDGIISEPLGGAHRDPALAIKNAAAAIDAEITQLGALTPNERKQQRRDKFTAMTRLAA